MLDYGAVIFAISVVLGIPVLGYVFMIYSNRRRLLNEQSDLEEIFPTSKGQAKIEIQRRLDQIQGLL